MPLSHLLLAGMTLGFINAVAGPVVTSISENGLLSLMTGAGPGFVIWMVAGWCLWSAWDQIDDRPATTTDHWVLCPAVVCLLIPSAMVAWFVCAAIGAWGYYRFNGNVSARSVHLVFLAMALRVPSTALLLSAASEPVLALDAIFVQAALALTPIETTLVGNVIVGRDGHNLAVMTGCSSFTNVSIGLLAWFAMTRARFHRIPARAAVAGIAVAVAIILLNVARLSLMAIDTDMYVLIHDGWGKHVFEGSLVLATLIITQFGLGERHAYRSHRGRTRRYRSA